MVERCVRDAEAVGSSPVTSTMLNVHNGLDRYEHSFFMHISIFYVSEQGYLLFFCYAGKAFGIYETATPCLVSLVKGLVKALSGISIYPTNR